MEGKKKEDVEPEKNMIKVRALWPLSFPESNRRGQDINLVLVFSGTCTTLRAVVLSYSQYRARSGCLSRVPAPMGTRGSFCLSLLSLTFVENTQRKTKEDEKEDTWSDPNHINEEELSDEDLELKKKIDLLVERAIEKGAVEDVQAKALDSMRDEIKNATSSMTSGAIPTTRTALNALLACKAI